LSAKRYEGFAEARVFPEDFSVLRPRRYRRIHVKNGARGRPFLFRFQAALLFSLENKIDVEFSEPVLHWTCKCFSTKRPKRRLLVNYLTESGNRAAPTCLEAGTNPLRVSVRRNRDTRKAGCAAASHEWEAVHEVFRASRPKFIGLAYSILRNKEDAEDAVQDAMLSAYRHLRSFKGRSAFTTWFTRIVFNAAFMIRRKRKPERIGSFPDSGETDETPWVERIPATQPDPEMVCAEAETFRAIDELLRKMNPVLRQAFTMAYYDEMSVEEAGAPPHPPRNFQGPSLSSEATPHPPNATFPRGPHPPCTTHAVFFQH
jgi:RNA polymerase sigma-70 factor (ECF subfamily)